MERYVCELHGRLALLETELRSLAMAWPAQPLQFEAGKFFVAAREASAASDE